VFESTNCLPGRQLQFYTVMGLGPVDCKVHRLYKFKDKEGRLLLVFETERQAAHARQFLGLAEPPIAGVQFRYCGYHLRMHPVEEFEASVLYCLWALSLTLLIC
jgi:hypothetical protein